MEHFMVELTLKIVITLLAGVFAGIVLFLASVLRRAFVNISEAEFHAIFTQIIQHGRRSVLINSLVLIPLVSLIIYMTVYGLRDALFIVGASLYVVGSFVLSRLLNEPNYTQLLASNNRDRASIAMLRDKLNRGNIARAALSAAGVLLMGVSFIS
jgi:uncharacterized membrane protein